MLYAGVAVNTFARVSSGCRDRTFVTPTRLARLPPIGPFLLFPAAGALWRRFLPKMSCASCSFLRFWRPEITVSRVVEWSM